MGRISWEDKTCPILSRHWDPATSTTVLTDPPPQCWERCAGGVNKWLSVASLQMVNPWLYHWFIFYNIWQGTGWVHFQHVLVVVSASILWSLQPCLLAISDSSLSSVFLPLFTRKSVKSWKGRSTLITTPDTNLSFMSPPRRYNLYFNTSEYSH